MSGLKSAAAVLEREPNTVAVDTGKQAGPVLVPKAGKRVDNYVTPACPVASANHDIPGLKPRLTTTYWDLLKQPDKQNVTSRVEAALDADFANGSMPA